MRRKIGGDGRRSAREDRLETERTDGEKKARLAAAEVSPDAQVWKFVEAVRTPGHEDVMGADLLELRSHIHVPMDEGADGVDKFRVSQAKADR